MNCDLCQSHKVFQRYHLVFLSSLQGSTAVQPDLQIKNKRLLCGLPVGCLGWRKKAFCCYKIGIYFWFLLFSLEEGSQQESCLGRGRTWLIHGEVPGSMNARVRRHRHSETHTTQHINGTQAFWGRLRK